MPGHETGGPSVAAPAYFAKHGVPKVSQNLANHTCINLRMVSGSVYAWEYEKKGRELNIKAGGQLLSNDLDLIVEAALAGHGLIHLIEDRVLPYIAERSLVRVLDDWCDPFDCYYLYYPSHRQPSAAFSLLLDALRYRD